MNCISASHNCWNSIVAYSSLDFLIIRQPQEESPPFHYQVGYNLSNLDKIQNLECFWSEILNHNQQKTEKKNENYWIAGAGFNLYAKYWWGSS